MAHKTFELCEFLTDVLKVDGSPGAFRTAWACTRAATGCASCALRRTASWSGPAFNKPRQLLESLEGIRAHRAARPDECCGFGGLFAVSEEAVSCMMGRDRIADHEQAGTEVLTSTDMSCLMHLDGLIRRQRKPMRVMHIAEIFAEAHAGRCELFEELGREAISR